MNEVEKKELRKLENKIANVHPFYVETIAEKLIKGGYGKVEDYKKEIERLKEAKQQAIKEFSEKLKQTLIINNEENTEIFDYDFTLETIDDLLKEYLGEES